jgi:nucleoside recognition membrane protein YjiH
MATFVFVSIFICALAFLMIPVQHRLSDTVVGVLLFIAAWFLHLLGDVALIAGLGSLYAQFFPAFGTVLAGVGLLVLVFASDRTPPEETLPARPPRR